MLLLASFLKTLLTLLLFLISTRVSAQILPDSTLGAESSVVEPNQSSDGVVGDVISGGAVRGTNLFHSFTDFNVDSDQGVYFTNPSGVTNILTRVTGKSPSNISGVLGVLGNANFFLLNPNGVIFGPNSRLDVKGSFIATTATGIHLSDGTTFSAKKPQSVPLLTISVPIGLGFTDIPGSIQVQGTGHNLVQPGIVIAPDVSLGPIPTGIGLQPGHTLALVGGDVTFTGGIATAPSGRIEIGSVSSGQVSLNTNALEGFSLGYEGVKDFQNILLARQSLLNASGVEGGNIQIWGKDVELTDNSLALIENQGLNSLGAISINASNSLRITGITQFTQRPTINLINESSNLSNQTISSQPNYTVYSGGLISQTFTGKGADINISTKELIVQNTGRIYLSTFGSGSGGNLSINAADSIKTFGISPFDPSYTIGSYIASVSAGAGPSGNIALTTNQLSLQDGSAISSSAFSNGTGGNVSVVALDSINLSGFNPSSFVPTIISSTTGGSGNGGELSINTRQLTVEDGGRVDASTIASGSAGSVTINASDSIKVDGTVPGSINPSLIISSANRIDPILNQVIGLPLELSGASGDVRINTERLSVTNGAQVTVKNDGSGDAGTLQINADSIDIDHQGSITASTAKGDGGFVILQTQNLQLQNNTAITAAAGTASGNGNGGNISLKAQNFQLRNSSTISATAGITGGSGNGGNIDIDTELLVIWEGSKITADAFEGRGGNIQIATQGIFRSLDSAITASSQLGINGNVQIVSLTNNPSPATVEPGTIPETPKVASVCQGRSNAGVSKFVITGTGGIPPGPDDMLSSNPGWHDHSVPAQAPDNSEKLDALTTGEPTQIVEAQGWRQNLDGTIILTAEANTVVPDSALSTPSCSPQPNVSELSPLRNTTQRHD